MLVFSFLRSRTRASSLWMSDGIADRASSCADIAANMSSTVFLVGGAMTERYEMSSEKSRKMYREITQNLSLNRLQEVC